MRPGVATAYGWELRKLAAQKRTYIGLGAAAALPVVFVVVMALQRGGPYDAPLGHNLRRTGLAISLVVLNFASRFGAQLVTALVAGTWTNLRPLQSQGGVDGFASLPTYNLAGAHFLSDLISLRHKEVADVSGNRLESLDSLESALVNSYDAGGSIPFTVAGGRSGQYTVGLAFSPGLLRGQSFDQVRRALASGVGNPTVKAIDAEANAITALLCKLTGGKPAAVCSAASITALRKQLS